MSRTPQQAALLRQIEEARAEVRRMRELHGPDFFRVAVLSWPSLKDVK